MNMKFLQDLLSRVSSRARDHDVGGRGRTSKSGSSPLFQLSAACHALMNSGGEASRILVAQRALEHYAQLDAQDRVAFFTLLAEEYAADSEAVHLAYAAYRDEESNANLERLFTACEPARQNLLRRLNLCPGGTFELVKMRADLLGLLKEHPELAPLDADFAHLFSSWFNRGFLVLESIDWNTPAAVLEKVIQYEAVHEIHDWEDLRRRLGPQDRRCYAFFHPATGDEPLIFVEVALCRGIPDNIQSILASTEELDANDADTAVFYSISNCQRGLKGVSFGNFLIKQVVQELKRELPNLREFVTLSPVPGFAAWLSSARSAGQVKLSPHAESALEEGAWQENEESRKTLAGELMPLAAHYFLEAKHRSGQPLDPVARFHLGNGASLHRMNWPGDTSTKGLKQAHGLMVNYRYQIDQIEQNHEAYSRESSIICSSEIRRMAAKQKPRSQQKADA
ncbi:MCD, Malonyl-CoA decarboxylase MCD [Halomonas huangheensis]|nr:malonyl-CoA decarboxylase [Halomonas huangheensis]ALM54561.1 MCD, Malonyl-CoA decarboxylase MCD [Halomonas huangheensis]